MPLLTRRGLVRYDNYQAISAFILISYMVGVTAHLGEHYNFFRLRWERLGGPPPYLLLPLKIHQRAL